MILHQSSTSNSFVSWVSRNPQQLDLKLREEAALFFSSLSHLTEAVWNVIRLWVKARLHCCCHDESFFGRDLIFRRPVDFSSQKGSRKNCFAPLGAVDGAPSTCCAKHSSVNFFEISSVAFYARKIFERPSGVLQWPPGVFSSLSGTFSRKIKKNVFHHFPSKFNIKYFSAMGVANFVTTLCETS